LIESGLRTNRNVSK